MSNRRKSNVFDMFDLFEGGNLTSNNSVQCDRFVLALYIYIYIYIYIYVCVRVYLHITMLCYIT